MTYHTTDRSADRFGVAPNEGAFLGLRIDGGTGTETTWLRDWETTQRYAEGFTDAVVTEHRSPEYGLAVTVVDVVARERDVLAQSVTVERSGDDTESDADSAERVDVELLAFENLNLVVSKEAEAPVQDWAREAENTDRARYRADADAIVHTKRGVDESTDSRQSVAIGMGFDRATASHHVGADAHEPDDTDVNPQDAYEAAKAAEFPGNDDYSGQTTGVLAAPLDLASGRDSMTVLFAAGEDATDVNETLATARERDPDDRRAAKREWIEGLLDDPPMPETDDAAVLAVCRRALVTLVTNYDPASGAIVASIATQSPYNLDWIRDGAYFNHALSLLGRHEWVETRNRWYADLQQRVEEYQLDQLGTPPGNWAMNYYADGVPGGPIPYEIDETGYGIWTLCDHYRVTGDDAYLRDVYPAIRRAADFLVAYRDSRTGLHHPAHEDDNLVPSQTVLGAGAVWLGLDAAASAATALGETADANRYTERREELRAAIDDHLWNPADGAYNGHDSPVEPVESLPLVPDPDAEPTLGWPIAFRPPTDDRMASHLDHVWAAIEPTFAEPERGERDFGQYEVKGLLTLARAWRGDDERLAQVRDGLRWVASEHATDGTHVMGELWLREDGEIRTSVSQPHTWEQLLFYYASLEAFPPADVDPPASGWTGVLERLRGTDT